MGECVLTTNTHMSQFLFVLVIFVHEVLANSPMCLLESRQSVLPVSGVVCFLHAQGAALGTMVGLLTFGNKKYEALDSTMRATIAPLHTGTQQMLPLIDRDTQAFTAYMVSVSC